MNIKNEFLLASDVLYQAETKKAKYTEEFNTFGATYVVRSMIEYSLVNLVECGEIHQFDFQTMLDEHNASLKEVTANNLDELESWLRSEYEIVRKAYHATGQI